MNNTKEFEEYCKDVSASEKLDKYIADMVEHDERERLKSLLDICEKSKDSRYDLPIDCKTYLPLRDFLFPHQTLDFMMWADKMGYIRRKEDNLFIVSSMIKRWDSVDSLKVMPEIVEAFVLYKKHVG